MTVNNNLRKAVWWGFVVGFCLGYSVGELVGRHHSSSITAQALHQNHDQT